MRTIIHRHALLAALLLAAPLSMPQLGAHAQSATSSASQARVIVKFRADTSQARIASASDRVRVLAQSTGLGLTGQGHIRDDMQVLSASGMSSAELVKRLAANPNVAYVQEDARMHIRALPNDPLFGQQWHLQAAQPAAINAQAAWDITTGSSSVVIAVVDTGVRYDHEDLEGKLLPGYDFIVDPDTSNDGGGRDPNASDAGDWEVFGTTTIPSSWHGTRVSSILAATSNNARGIAGVSWQSLILPVRALGSGGGFLSDIVAGMRWAAGLNVPGVPDNPNPARIINMSLGGPGSCDPVYQQAIDEITARGVLIVAAAGNDSGGVERPANCRGVLAVAGLRHVGSKVGYSSLGPEIGISAPAGNCVDVANGAQCQFPIDAANNAGIRAPSTFTNTYTTRTNPDANVGTSFSAPLAAGVAALMLSANPALTPAKLIERIKLAARPFPVDSTLSTCSPASDASTQCNCTTFTCGAGMLDAPASLNQALLPAARFNVGGSLVPGATLTLDGSASGTTGSAIISSYEWSLSGTTGTLSNAARALASLTVPSAGNYFVTLKVTDSNGRTDIISQNLVVSTPAPPPESNSKDDGGGGSAPVWGVAAALLLAGLLRRKAP